MTPENQNEVQKPQPPLKITPPEVPPPGEPKKVRPSEIIIIILIILGCALCGLLIWGLVALIHQLPTWWQNIFGLIVPSPLI